MSWGEWAIAGFVVMAPFIIWSARNEYVFGQFIPLSTQGLGSSLYLNKLEWTIGSAVDGDNQAKMLDELTGWRAATGISRAGKQT